MTSFPADAWPQYTYIVPEVYTRARVRLAGLGTYAPAGIITNDFFAYISTRLGDPRKAEDLERVTGLSTRHVRASTLELCRKMAGDDAPGLIDDPQAPREETLVDMALIAAQRALASAGRSAAEIDMIVGASSSDNDAFPTIAGQVQHRLGLRPIRATMLRGACASQTEAFQVCAEALSCSSARLVLLVTSEGLLPNIMNVLDWKTSSLFGEGAAAFLLERGEEGDETYAICGYDAGQAPALFYQTPLRKDVIEMAEVDMKIRQLYREGKGKELSQLLAQNLVGYTKMNGKEVFREAPRAMAEAVDACVRHAGLAYDDVGYIIPHQANSRITRRMGELLINDYGWPAATMEKLVDNFRYYGNLSNASIATALAELVYHDRIQDGQWLALPAVGGGMHYGCWLVRYRALAHPQAVLQPLQSLQLY
jgi:3-oxoacyl-[acyl-carrier-protein] synthase-3